MRRAEIDRRVATFLERPLAWSVLWPGAPPGLERPLAWSAPWEATGPRLWLDAACLEARRDGRIVPAAVTIAVAVDACGRREVPGMDIGACEAEEAGLA